MRIFILLFISINMFAQSKTECINLMDEYGKNYSKPEYSNDFVEKKLNPTLQKVKELICENNDKELLEKLLEMITYSSGSANEFPADILGGIFICNQEIVETELKGKFKNQLIFDYLELGFLNITMHWPFDEKHMELQKRMYKLIK